MENSAFATNKHNKQSSYFIKVKELNTSGATSKSFKVRRYGKLLFLKQPYDINNSQLQDAFRKEFEVGFNLDHNGLVRYVAFDDETCSIFLNGLREPPFHNSSKIILIIFATKATALDLSHNYSMLWIIFTLTRCFTST